MLWITSIKKARTTRIVSTHYMKVSTHLQRSKHSLTYGKQGQTKAAKVKTCAEKSEIS